MLGVLAVFAVSAVASATASAALCEKESGGTKFALCLNEPLELVEGTFKLHIADDPTTPTKAFVLKGSSIQLKCPEILLQLGATITAGKTVSLGIKLAGVVLHFIGCTVPEPEHCIINNSLIITTTLDGVPTPKAEDKKLLFLPEKGTTFSTVKVESSGGTCLIAGSDVVAALNGKEGEGPLCTDNDIETTTILHLLECEGTTKSTNLKFAGKEVEFKGAVSTLLENEKTKWAIILGK
jgi:hypothetical protein